MRKKLAASILCVWTILIGTMNGLMWLLNLSIMAAELTLHGNKLMMLLVHPKCFEVAIFLGHPVAMWWIMVQPVLEGGLYLLVLEVGWLKNYCWRLKTWKMMTDEYYLVDDAEVDDWWNCILATPICPLPIRSLSRSRHQQHLPSLQISNPAPGGIRWRPFSTTTDMSRRLLQRHTTSLGLAQGGAHGCVVR